jgi:hypothetical protein
LKISKGIRAGAMRSLQPKKNRQLKLSKDKMAAVAKKICELKTNY